MSIKNPPPDHEKPVLEYRITANDQQVGGEHYKLAIQPWDYIVANGLGYLEGNLIKYVTRYKRKGGVKDLKKAQHCLAKLIEVQLAWEAKHGLSN